MNALPDQPPARAAAVLLATAVLLSCPPLASWIMADEPTQKLLDRLRNEGRFDEAIQQLRELDQRADIPADLKQVLPYEWGKTLLSAARGAPENAQRVEQLQQATKQLEKFLQQQPEHEDALRAQSELGVVFVERARSALNKANRLGWQSESGEQELQQARDLFARAVNSFRREQSGLRKKLSGNRILDPRTDRERIQKRDAWRIQYVQSSLLIPAAMEQQAACYATDDKQRRELLQQAAEMYGGLYERFRTRIAGLYARMYQGRCLTKLGSHQAAQAIFKELLAQPDEPAVFVEFKNKAVLLAADSWLDPSQRQFATAIEQLTRQLQLIAVADLAKRTPMQWALARAHRLRADALAETDVEAANKSQQAAVELARQVASRPGPHREAAQALLKVLAP